MNNDDARIKAFLDEIGKKRDMPNFFDRFERATITSGAVKLHLDVIETDKSKPTVIFMPGTNAYAVIYGEYLSALADRGFNIVGFDPRGHGRSGGARGSYTVPELMGDYRAAIRYARARFGDPIVASGSSQGGFTSFYIAAEGYPIAGAVCHNIADLGDPRSVELTANPTLSKFAKPFIMFNSRFLPEFKVPMTFYINLKDEPIRDLGNSETMIKTGALLVPFIRLRGMASLGSEPLPCPVEEIDTPVMVIHGDKDVIFPQNYIEYIYNRLTCKKSLKVYEGCHHYILFDHVDKVIPDVTAWIDEICG